MRSDALLRVLRHVARAEFVNASVKTAGDSSNHGMW